MSGVDSRKKAVAFLVLRWLFVPILFYCFGGFLEGPPTRVVVRSFAFVFGCFSLSLLAAQFLRQVRRIPIALSLLQALVIPGGYVHFAQLYYHGGKNQDYSITIGIFFLLMMLNAAVYLNGLFALRHRGDLAEETIEPIPIEDDEYPEDDEYYDFELKSFEVTLYALDSEGRRGKVAFHKKGKSQVPESIVLDGYSKDLHVDLEGYWDEIFENQREEYQTNISTYETIVKFGDTMQLVDDYQLVFKLKYKNI